MVPRQKLIAIHNASLLLAVISITLLWASVAEAGTITQTTCPIEIIHSGVYSLANDVTCAASTEDGIDILASGVTLFLNGHTITGAGAGPGAPCSTGTGINVGSSAPGFPKVSGVGILGRGTVSNFFVGVGAQNSADSFAAFVTVTAPQCNPSGSPTSVGFVVQAPGGGWNLSGNVVQEPGINSFGIVLAANGNALVGNNVIDSIALFGSSNNTIVANTANENFGGIILYAGSNNNQIYANTTKKNNSVGCGPITASTYPCSGLWMMSGATGNNITGNWSFDNVPFDMQDDNKCGSNKWKGNHFGTANESCIH